MMDVAAMRPDRNTAADAPRCVRGRCGGAGGPLASLPPEDRALSRDGVGAAAGWSCPGDLDSNPTESSPAFPGAAATSCRHR